MNTEAIHKIAREWANGELKLYEALYAAYELGFEDGVEANALDGGHG